MWLRLYTELLNNPKVQNLRSELFKIWINVLCVAKIVGGTLPPVGDLGFRLRIPEKAMRRALTELHQAGLVDEIEPGVFQPHDWNEYQYHSDSSTERVRKHRLEQSRNVQRNGGNGEGNVSVTVQSREEQKQIQSREEQSQTDAVMPTSRDHYANGGSKPAPHGDKATGGIRPETWEAFQARYVESGKPLNDEDWRKAAMEAASQDLTDEDMVETVIPALVAELPEWADRQLTMIPLPVNWLRARPWTRVGKPRSAPPTREERKQRQIDREWEELGNGTKEL